MSTQTLKRLQRKLERLELDHLRAHAAELAERLEGLEAQLTDAKAQLVAADEAAEFWQQQAFSLQQAIDSEHGASHRCVGLHKSGDLLVVRIESASVEELH